MTNALRDVTIVALDCVACPLTRLALEDCLRVVEPAEVLVWTDKKITVPKGALQIKAELDSLDSVATKLWTEVPKHIKTTHMLLVQWDGWIVDGKQWDSNWLDLDFIGAPWWYKDGLNVGNGGFSLRSRDLMRFIGSHPERFMPSTPEDTLLCRLYRRLLEVYAFEWATEPQAARFAFERTAPIGPTFGFHGSFNWPRILTREALYQRISLASSIPYVQSKSDFDPNRIMLESTAVA